MTFIDLRSDTVTRPSEAMRRAMAAAEVGDDVFGEDPTVRQLEAEAAEITGFEASLFVPTGTMGNEIALHLHARPGSEVLCEARSHVLQLEMGGMAALSGLLPRPIDGNGDGVVNLDLGAFEAPAAASFDLSAQDDATGALLLIDSTSGRFRYARCGTNAIVLEGIGTVRVVNDCKIRFKVRGAITIDATIRPCDFSGKAHVKAKALSINDRLVDSDTANNTGLCS